VGNYRFLDNTSIEITAPGEALRLMQVSVTKTELSFMVVGRGKATYHRVREYSAKVLQGGRVLPTRKGRPGSATARTPDTGGTREKPATSTKGP
jgi:hypothetical protein